MKNLDGANCAEVNNCARAQLEQAIVEAHYLGHAMRLLAADPDFGFRQITASVCEPLIAWAKFIEDRLEAGEPPFKAMTTGGTRKAK